MNELSDYRIKHALDVIKGTYGDVASVDAKKKDLIKFGRNPNVGTSGRFTIWYTGQDDANETYPADNTNPIDTISSSDAGDSGDVVVEGHSEASGNKTFVIQTATLDGQNKVTLGTALNRVTRVRRADGNAVNLAGEIYVYQDTTISGGKPSDTTKIHLTIPAGENQSQKASTSLSSSDYWIVTGFSAGYLTKTGSNVADVQLEVRTAGGVFLPKAKPIIIRTGDDSFRAFNPYLVIPKNADVRLTAQATATGQIITGDIYGYLAKVIPQT